MQKLLGEKSQTIIALEQHSNSENSVFERIWTAIFKIDRVIKISKDIGISQRIFVEFVNGLNAAAYFCFYRAMASGGASIGFDNGVNLARCRSYSLSDGNSTLALRA